MKIRLTKNLEPLRASALARLDEVISKRLYSLAGSPIATLRALKLAEAKRVLAGEGPAQMLSAEAAALGLELVGLAQTVVAKAFANTPALAEIEACRQSAQAAIRSAPHPAAIDAVLFELELPR